VHSPYRVHGPYRLYGMELATALVYGLDVAVTPLAVERPTPSPRAVLESILERALQHPPCVLGFSGGRDSSALLALAAHVARRQGLDAPIAATNVFPGDVQAAESEWQELLIRHLGVTQWERLRFTGEIDVIGPVAAPLLRRFGPTFPFNGHFGMPSAALAAHGTYVTGIGGDELFEPNELNRLALVLAGRTRPRRDDGPRALRHLGPGFIARHYYRRLLPGEPWLRPEVSRDLAAGLAASLASQSLWYSQQIRNDVWRDRARAALQATLAAFAATIPAEMVHPFQEPSFLGAVSAHVGRIPYRSRTAAMMDLFGDVLPPDVVRRPTKASFDSIFFHEHSRAFVDGWDGTGVDTGLVDVDRLRETWQQTAVDARSLSLLQQAWCAQIESPGKPLGSA
jgi:Asparagine synthase